MESFNLLHLCELAEKAGIDTKDYYADMYRDGRRTKYVARPFNGTQALDTWSLFDTKEWLTS